MPAPPDGAKLERVESYQVRHLIHPSKATLNIKSKSKAKAYLTAL